MVILVCLAVLATAQSAQLLSFAQHAKINIIGVVLVVSTAT
jgi:hypothetical protein